jgi:hypothetical protein
LQRKEAQKRGQEFMQGNYKSGNSGFGGGFSGQFSSSSSFDTTTSVSVVKESYR